MSVVRPTNLVKPQPKRETIVVGGVAFNATELGAASTHPTDPTDAHDASAISIADVGGHFGATDVEGALQEIPKGAASPFSIRYTFSTTTTDADPGAGHLRLSNAAQYLAVTVRADLADAEGADVTALLDLMSAGYLRLQARDDPTKWLVASVSAVASPSGYRNITIANIAKSANSPFANGDLITLSFVPTSAGGAALTVEEVDGTPSDVVDTIVFPNGTLAIVGSVATYTPAGGSGAPDDAEYLVTAAHADLSAERVVDKGAVYLLQRPAAVNTEDDHFDTSPLNAKWLAYTGHDATCDLTAVPGWVSITGVGSKLQAVPAGDWTIETEVIGAFGGTTGGYTSDGLVISSGTTWSTSTAIIWGPGYNNSDNVNQRWTINKYVNGVYNATPLNYGGGGLPYFPLDHTFIRLQKAGTNYRVYVSADGKTWIVASSLIVIGFTITHFGFDGAAGAKFNYFRRT